jgi:hypothetical protein
VTLTEYFTTCKKEDEETLRQFLKDEKHHTIIQTINANVQLYTYVNSVENKVWAFQCDISGTEGDVIVHSRRDEN